MYTAPYATATRSDQAYADLKRRLLAGEFPLNQRLAEERLANLLGASRTPIREALLRLHAEGLVQRRDEGGYGPIVPDVEVMHELYEVRGALEVTALQRPAVYGTTHDAGILEGLREEWLELQADPMVGPDAEFVLIDETFHLTLAEASGNAVLAELVQQVNERIRVVRMQDFLADGRISATVAEHLEVLDEVLAGHIDRAERLLITHINLSVSVVEDRVRRAITRMVAER